MILFFISCFKQVNTGAGGHYYSLMQMATALDLENRIVVVGDFFPPAYMGSDVEYIDGGYDSLPDRLPESIFQNKISLVHAYDTRSAVTASQVASACGVPLVVTKPGGPPQKGCTVYFKNQIVFHGHDYDLFDRKKIDRPRNLACIPNRVLLERHDDAADRKNPFSQCNGDCLKILRIARIGEIYLDSILQSIHLVERVREAGIDAVLAIIGTVQDDKAFERIEQLVTGEGKETYVKLLSSPEYTVNAAELIPFADVVVGTGRSFMEGMANGKLMFFPVKEEALPCFLTEGTYQEAFYHNFSPRVTKTMEIDPEKRLQEFIALIESGELKQYERFVLDTFLRNHDVNEGVNRLKEYYASVSQDVETRLDYFRVIIQFKMKVITDRLYKSS